MCAIFEEEGAERLPTSTILEKLRELEEAPWGSLRGEPLDARGLARLLKPYGVQPKKLRERDGEEGTFRGYERANFEDAWARYAPETPENTEQAEHENPHEQRDVPHVPLVPANPDTGEKCKHEVEGGCWLCKKYHPGVWDKA